MCFITLLLISLYRERWRFCFWILAAFFFSVGVCDSNHWQKVALVNSLAWLVPGLWGWDIHINGKHSHGKKNALSLSYSENGSPQEQCMKGRDCWDSSQRQLDSAKPICETWYYNNIKGKNKGCWTCRCNAFETVIFRQTVMFCCSKQM